MLTFLFTLISNIKVYYCAIVDYRFYNNIGQVFYDYSGNNYHAVNGETHLNQVNDVAYSDRGIYFSNNYQIVNLPPNTLITTGYTLQSPFSVILWFYSMETSSKEIGLYRRYLTTGNRERFVVLRYNDFSLKYLCELKICAPISKGYSGFTTFKNINNIWEIFVVSVNSTTFKFSSTGNLNSIQTLPAPYSEAGLSLKSYLGKIISNKLYNMKCFMYRFMITNSIVDISSLYST